MINLSSIAALRPGGGSYGAAKAAVIAWTYSLAAELRRSRLVAQTLTGRAGRPQDVAAAVRFLASPGACSTSRAAAS